MSRLKGDDDLFRLIHSLTPEEKGYYKKLAKRHSAKGTNYVRLFDAINEQKVFEEKLLKEQFRHYTVMKVYLKEMITDSLMIYHKFNHPHLELLSQVQRVHILLIKGMVDEAMKVLRKVILRSRKMEIFAVERYLLRMYSDISQQHLSNPTMVRGFYEQYKNDTARNWEQEQELTQWELLNAEWFVRTKADGLGKEECDQVRAMPTNSIRSEIKKLNCLFYICELTGRSAENYEITKSQVEQANEYKQQADPSFNSVYLQCNHILNCIHLKKYEEALLLTDELVESEKKLHFYDDLAFIKSVQLRLRVFFHQHRIADGLALIQTEEGRMLPKARRLGDETTLLQFYFHKAVFEFTAGEYQRCWLTLQEIDGKQLLANSVSDYADFELLQLMVQLEMKHYVPLKSMIKNALRKFKVHQITDYPYQLLLTFFRQVKPGNTVTMSSETLDLLRAYSQQYPGGPFKIFHLLKYTDWLLSVARSIPLQEVLAQEL